RPTEPGKVDVIGKVDLAATDETTKIAATEEVSTEETITVEEAAVVGTEEGEKVEAVETEEEVAMKTDALGQTEGTGNVEAQKDLSVDAVLEKRGMAIGAAKIDLGPNHFRDMSLFPEQGEYYFTINVLDGKVNMAPSRYGIGQFNR